MKYDFQQLSYFIVRANLSNNFNIWKPFVEKYSLGSSCVAQRVEDLVLPQLQHRFDPWLGNFHMLQAQPIKKIHTHTHKFSCFAILNMQVADTALIPCCCGSGVGLPLWLRLDPQLGTSMCCGCSPKKTKAKQNKTKTCFDVNSIPLKKTIAFGDLECMMLRVCALVVIKM